MSCIVDAAPCREEALVALSNKYPDIAAQDHGDFVRLSPVDPASSVTEVWCDYRELAADSVQRDADRFRYTFSHTTRSYEYVGPYSHPSQEGCWIAARRYFIDTGMIVVPTDNSHLTAKTAAYVANAQTARNAVTLVPMAGDVILDRNGQRRRLSNVYGDEKVQAAKALEHSYYLHPNGGSSFSGACGHVVPQSELSTEDLSSRVRFWVFKDNRAGAGRGIDVFVDVAVWRWTGCFEGKL